MGVYIRGIYGDVSGFGGGVVKNMEKACQQLNFKVLDRLLYRALGLGRV